MRPIKFRAWDKEKKLMVFGAGKYMALQVNEREEYYSNLELMQYTGLKDCAGKEIYEGDIVRWRFNGEDIIYQIYWRDNLAKFEGKRKYEIGFFPDSFTEVIGNIYEHPHLLENNQ